MIEDDRRSPTDLCFDTLDALGSVWGEMNDQDDESRFIELVVQRTWDDGITGAKRLREISADLVDPTVHTDSEWLQSALEVAVAFACEVQFCAKHGDIELAWQRLSEAKYWLGFITAEWSRIKLQEYSSQTTEVAASIAAKTLSELGTDARHSDHRAMRDSLTKWFDEHESEYQHVSDAARAAAKIEPIKQSTAYKWFRDHKRTRNQ